MNEITMHELYSELSLHISAIHDKRQTSPKNRLSHERDRKTGTGFGNVHFPLKRIWKRSFPYILI